VNLGVIHICSHKAKFCAERAGGHAHYVYLAAATLLDGNIVLRIASGGCLVLCLLAAVLKDAEEAPR
jgi:hypothetical protein